MMLESRMIKTGLKMVVAAAMLAAMGTEAAAQKRDLIGSYRDWDAFTGEDSRGNKICYMISVPKDTNPKNVNRGDIYVTVTHRPRAEVRNEVSIIVGYPLRVNTEVTGSIGNRRFDFFTEGDGAWLRTTREDAEFVAAMRAGSSLVVRGTSQRGTNTRDRYSLIGFTVAHQAITQNCAS